MKITVRFATNRRGQTVAFQQKKDGNWRKIPVFEAQDSVRIGYAHDFTNEYKSNW